MKSKLSAATNIGWARRAFVIVFAGSAAGGIAAFGLSAPAAVPAEAAPDPCAASEVARTIGTVATSMGNYLDSHPQTNQALTAISKQQAGPQSLVALKSYFDANPQASKEMQQLQAPLQALSARCDLPITLPQVMGLMQQAQQQAAGGGLPSSLPGALQAAQNAGVPAATAPGATSPASALSTGTGPLPGPLSASAG